MLRLEILRHSLQCLAVWILLVIEDLDEVVIDNFQLIFMFIDAGAQLLLCFEQSFE